MAGLPSCNALVWVGPPLAASAPSSGSWFWISPEAAKPQEVPGNSRLLQSEATVLEQLSPSVGFATIVFLKVKLVIRRLPTNVAPFSLRVPLVSVSAPSLEILPPKPSPPLGPPFAELPLIVLFVTA